MFHSMCNASKKKSDSRGLTFNSIYCVNTQKFAPVFTYQIEKLLKSYVFERCCDWLCFVLVFQVLVCDLKYVLLLFTLLLVLCHVTCIRGRDTQKTVHFIPFPRFVGFQQRHGCCIDHKCKLLTRVDASQQALKFRSKKRFGRRISESNNIYWRWTFALFDAAASEQKKDLSGFDGNKLSCHLSLETNTERPHFKW